MSLLVSIKIQPKCFITTIVTWLFLCDSRTAPRPVGHGINKGIYLPISQVCTTRLFNILFFFLYRFRTCQRVLGDSLLYFNMSNSVVVSAGGSKGFCLLPNANGKAGSNPGGDRGGHLII